MSWQKSTLSLVLLLLMSGRAGAESRPEFGNGIDMMTHEVKTVSRAVVPAEPSDPAQEPVCSYQQRVGLQIFRDVRELETVVGMSAGASLSILIATATGSFGYSIGGENLSNRVFVVFQADVQNCSYRMKNPVLSPPEVEQWYVKDYARFRQWFGDRYVNVVTTGGSFYGIIAIDAGESRLSFDAFAELKVELGKMVFKVGWHEALQKITERYKNTEVMVLINGVRRAASTPEHLWYLYDSFTSVVQLEACTGASGYRDCPYVDARYEDYAGLMPSQDNSILMRRAAEYIGELHGRQEVLNEVGRRIDFIAAHPELHHTATTGEDVEAVVRRIRSNIAVMTDAISDRIETCRNNPLSQPACQSASEAFEDDVLALELELPRRNYPSNCRAIQRLHEVRNDGRFTVYMNGEGGKPYDVACTGMGSQTPKTYLLLKRTSPRSKFPRYNFSRYVDFPPGRNGEGKGSLTTVYRGILVEELGQDLLEVAPEQSELAESIGDPIQVTTSDGLTDLVSRCRYGWPASSASVRAEFIGNIDLTFTPFAIDRGVSWVARLDTIGAISERPYLAGQAVSRADRKSIDLRVEPSAAESESIVYRWVSTSGGTERQRLVLRYVGAESTSTTGTAMGS